METLAELALRLRLEAGYSNRSQFAREVGVSSQAILQIENGTTREMKGRTLAGYIRVLGEAAASKLAPYKAKESATLATPEEYAFIKRYEAKLSAGDGHENGDHVQIDGTHAFRISWLKKKGLSPEHLCVLEVEGESMAPDIKSGDVVLIDMTKVELESGEVFAIQTPDGARIKRIIRQADGRIRFSSDNPDKGRYPDEIYSEEEASRIKIIGKKVWRGG